MEDAELDYEAVQALYEEAAVGRAFDAAFLERGADGKVKVVDKHEGIHAPWCVDGSDYRSPLPPSCRGSVWASAPRVGAGIGAISGHLKDGMSSDLKELGTVLDKGQAGLIVLYATNMADQIAASIKAENRYVSDAIDADADELAKQLKAVDAS